MEDAILFHPLSTKSEQDINERSHEYNINIAIDIVETVFILNSSVSSKLH